MRQADHGMHSLSHTSELPADAAGHNVVGVVGVIQNTHVLHEALQTVLEDHRSPSAHDIVVTRSGRSRYAHVRCRADPSGIRRLHYPRRVREDPPVFAIYVRDDYAEARQDRVLQLEAGRPGARMDGLLGHVKIEATPGMLGKAVDPYMNVLPAQVRLSREAAIVEYIAPGEIGVQRVCARIADRGLVYGRYVGIVGRIGDSPGCMEAQMLQTHRPVDVERVRFKLDIQRTALAVTADPAVDDAQRGVEVDAPLAVADQQSYHEIFRKTVIGPGGGFGAVETERVFVCRRLLISGSEAPVDKCAQPAEREAAGVASGTAAERAEVVRSCQYVTIVIGIAACQSPQCGHSQSGEAIVEHGRLAVCEAGGHRALGGVFFRSSPDRKSVV